MKWKSRFRRFLSQKAAPAQCHGAGWSAGQWGTAYPTDHSAAAMLASIARTLRWLRPQRASFQLLQAPFQHNSSSTAVDSSTKHRKRAVVGFPSLGSHFPRTWSSCVKYVVVREYCMLLQSSNMLFGLVVAPCRLRIACAVASDEERRH